MQESKILRRPFDHLPEDSQMVAGLVEMNFSLRDYECVANLLPCIELDWRIRWMR